MTTIIESALMFQDPASGSLDSTLSDIGFLFGVDCAEVFQDYKNERKFGRLHKALLRLDGYGWTLEDYLARQDTESLAGEIDQMDSSGRTALGWAVESGRPDAVGSLLCYGANPRQARECAVAPGSLPLLHLAIAGPTTNNHWVEVVRTLLDWVLTSTVRITKGGPHYTSQSLGIRTTSCPCS